MSDQWIIVRNWESFQHYRGRRPVWIKLYVELLDSADFLQLREGARSTLFGLWLTFASARGQVPLDTRWLTRKLNHRVTREQLDRLENAGFIQFAASKPLPIDYQEREESLALTRAGAPSQEAETEKEKSSEAVQEGRATARESTQGLQPLGKGVASLGLAMALANSLQHKDDHTQDVIVSFASKLPPAAFVTVREKIAEGNGRIQHDAKYAVAELQRMVDEKQYA